MAKQLPQWVDCVEKVSPRSTSADFRQQLFNRAGVRESLMRHMARWDSIVADKSRFGRFSTQSVVGGHSSAIPLEFNLCGQSFADIVQQTRTVDFHSLCYGDEFENVQATLNLLNLVHERRRFAKATGKLSLRNPKSLASRFDRLDGGSIVGRNHPPPLHRFVPDS
jgi:hypothetical protein